MNDEIKEILDYLQENSKKDEATKQLVGYITNLKERIEKAVEYLKDNACYTDENEFVSDLRYDNCEELLNILNGKE